jgi:hypothetical protein
MKILLHICCAPCSPFPVEELKRLGHDFHGFFYNPNIHPLPEFERRRKTLEDLAQEIKLDIHFSSFCDIDAFRRGAKEEEQKGNSRCLFCYRLRLDQTAQLAKDEGFKAFTSTLLVSPYQKHDLIIQAAQEVQEARNMKFFYRDFRPGWSFSRQETFRRGLYRQKYCGCIFSEGERQEEKRKNKKEK